VAVLGSLRRRAVDLARRYASPVVARSLEREEILANPYVSAKLQPLARGETANGRPYHLLTTNRWAAPRIANGSLPVPPLDLRAGWDEEFLPSGERDVATMARILTEAGAELDALTAVLDFGCAAARMLRFCGRYFPAAEAWGVDLKAEHIEWCHRYLSPPFRFALTTSQPHLPFEDRSFDLIYCGSVFTHIGDLADAWFLELLRLLRSGGYLYLTIHDEYSAEVLLRDFPQRDLTRALRRLDGETSVLTAPYLSFSVNVEPRAEVFYNCDLITQRWGRFATLISVTREAMDYQTALLFRK
jgi:SAM-dependent methyltransferase